MTFNLYRGKRITDDDLKALGACPNGRAKFRRVFPDGMTLSRRNLFRAAIEGLPLDWLVYDTRVFARGIPVESYMSRMGIVARAGAIRAAVPLGVNPWGENYKRWRPVYQMALAVHLWALLTEEIEL